MKLYPRKKARICKIQMPNHKMENEYKMESVYGFLRFFRNLVRYCQTAPHPTEKIFIEKLRSQLALKSKVVMFGLGKSVNEHEINAQSMPQDWYYVALSRWVHHNYIPDLIFFEIANTKGSKNFTADFMNTVNKKSQAYKNTLIVVGGLEQSDWCDRRTEFILNKANLDIKNNLHFIRTFPIGARSKNSLKLLLKLFFMLRSIGLVKLMFLHSRSSVVGLILLAVQLKVREVCLVGFDGISGYFAPKGSEFYGEYYAEKNLNSALHSTFDPKYGLPTTQECISVLKSRIRLYTNSTESILYPDLPVKFPENKNQRKINENTSHTTR